MRGVFDADFFDDVGVSGVEGVVLLSDSVEISGELFTIDGVLNSESSADNWQILPGLFSAEAEPVFESKTFPSGLSTLFTLLSSVCSFSLITSLILLFFPSVKATNFDSVFFSLLLDGLRSFFLGFILVLRSCFLTSCERGFLLEHALSSSLETSGDAKQLVSPHATFSSNFESEFWTLSLHCNSFDSMSLLLVELSFLSLVSALVSVPGLIFFSASRCLLSGFWGSSSITSFLFPCCSSSVFSLIKGPSLISGVHFDESELSFMPLSLTGESQIST